MGTGERGTSFGAVADSYEAGRPDYPVDAVAWMLQPLDPGPRTVLDVGAGTGKLTRLVASLADTTVIAVEPDAQMLDALRERSPQIPTLTGTAESVPRADASADAAVLGQAWHWVDPVAACAELGRVVRPGGVLGLIWNVRDERTDWVRRMSVIMHGSPAEEMVAGAGPTIAAPFGPGVERRWQWATPMSRAQMLHMARSRSYLITADAAERDRVERELSALFDDLGLRGESTIDMPYVTAAFRAVRDG